MCVGGGSDPLPGVHGGVCAQYELGLAIRPWLGRQRLCKPEPILCTGAHSHHFPGFDVRDVLSCNLCHLCSHMHTHDHQLLTLLRNHHVYP